MGFKQTATHRYGKGSYHQIGLVRGQFGNVPMEQWLDFVQRTGFDGWEEASWELDLDKCMHRRRRRGLCQGTRRPGQEARPGDLHRRHPSARPGPGRRAERQDAAIHSAARRSAAYKAWRDKGNKPPRTDPYFVPDEVGKLIHDQAAEGPDRLRAAGPFPRQAAESQGRAAGLRRLAGPLLEPLVPVPASAHQPGRPCHPRRPPGQPGAAGRALRPGLGRLQEVRRDLRSRMPSQRTGDGRHRVGQRLHQPPGARPATTAWSASTSTARTWNGKASRSSSSSASSASSSTAPTSRACR